MANNGTQKKWASPTMARSRPQKIWASLAMARLRPQKYGLAQLADGL